MNDRNSKTYRENDLKYRIFCQCSDLYSIESLSLFTENDYNDINKKLMIS